MKNFIFLLLSCICLTAQAQVPQGIQIVVSVEPPFNGPAPVEVTWGSSVWDFPSIEFEAGIAAIILENNDNLQGDFPGVGDSIVVNVNNGSSLVQIPAPVWSVPYALISDEVVADDIIRTPTGRIRIVEVTAVVDGEIPVCTSGRIPTLSELKIIANDPVMNLLDFTANNENIRIVIKSSEDNFYNFSARTTLTSANPSWSMCVIDL